jgi:import receptor subunit TOM70
LSGELALACVEYKKCVDVAPDFTFAHIQYGVALYRSNQIAEAMAYFEEILAKFEQQGDIYNYYGELLLDQSKFDEAVEQFEKAISLDSANPVGYINKALIQFQVKRDFEGGEYWCRKAIEGECAIIPSYGS